MKTIEQVAWKIAGEIGESYSLEDNEVILNPAQFATKFLEAYLAQQEPVGVLSSDGYWPIDSRVLGKPVFLAPPFPKVEQELADAFVLLWSSDDRAAWDKKAVEHFDSLLAKVESGSFITQQEPVSYEYQARDGTWHGFLNQRHYESTVEDGSWTIRALYTAPPTTIPEDWQPISTAPTDGTEIIGFCNHDADEYSLNEGKTLTNYGCACESYGHVEDGQHIVYWEPDSTEGSWEEGYYPIPGYWAAEGSDGECCANPTHWQPLPPPPGEKK